MTTKERQLYTGVSSADATSKCLETIPAPSNSRGVNKSNKNGPYFKLHVTPFNQASADNSLKFRSHLSKDDATNQGRYLLNTFIHDRMEKDRILDVPALEELQEPDTPTGPPIEHLKEIGRALRCIGDELEKDDELQKLIDAIPPESEKETFVKVALNFFKDGVFNWGRVVTLFYFAYKICVKAINKIPLMKSVINFVVEFMRDYVIQWVIQRGGWGSVLEYFGATRNQILFVFFGVATVIGGIYVYKHLS